jgi:hypothetical protein
VERQVTQSWDHILGGISNHYFSPAGLLRSGSISLSAFGTLGEIDCLPTVHLPSARVHNFSPRRYILKSVPNGGSHRQGLTNSRHGVQPNVSLFPFDADLLLYRAPDVFVHARSFVFLRRFNKVLTSYFVVFRLRIVTSSFPHLSKGVCVAALVRSIALLTAGPLFSLFSNAMAHLIPRQGAYSAAASGCTSYVSSTIRYQAWAMCCSRAEGI